MFTVNISRTDARRLTLHQHVPVAEIKFEDPAIWQIALDREQGLCRFKLIQRPTVDQRSVPPREVVDPFGVALAWDGYTETLAIAVEYTDSELEFLRRLSV